MAEHLTMTLKREWFDKILMGEKRIEYREDKPYWRSRIKSTELEHITFKNGYSRKAPNFSADVLRIDFISSGKETDLKIDGPVIAIELCQVQPGFDTRGTKYANRIRF